MCGIFGFAKTSGHQTENAVRDVKRCTNRTSR